MIVRRRLPESSARSSSGLARRRVGSRGWPWCWICCPEMRQVAAESDLSLLPEPGAGAGAHAGARLHTSWAMRSRLTRSTTRARSTLRLGPLPQPSLFPSPWTSVSRISRRRQRSRRRRRRRSSLRAAAANSRVQQHRGAPQPQPPQPRQQRRPQQQPVPRAQGRAAQQQPALKQEADPALSEAERRARY
jgi:hypothetical protein